LNRSTWRHPLALVALTELGYLLYFHVVACAPHSILLFSWLPFGRWTMSDPAGASLLYVLCLGALFALYAWLLRILSLRPESAGAARIVFGGAALFSLTLVFLPTLMSKDLYDYMGHGRVLTVHGANPFVTPASEFTPDLFTQAMGWSAATPLYGPARASISAVLTIAGGGSFLRTVLVFKLFFVVVHLVNGLLVMKVAGGWGESSGAPGPLRASAFYLWNPLALTQVVGDAHNDGVVLLWILLGILMLQRRDELTGAACTAMSVMLKYVTAPIALLLALQRWREAGARRALLFVLVCAAVTVLAYAPYLSGFSATHFLRPYEHSSYQGSLMMMIEMILGQVIPGENVAGSTLARALLAVSAVAAAALGLWFLRAAWRVETLMEAVEMGTRLLLFYLLFLTALLRTSYVVWILGLAAVVSAVPLRRTVAIFSCTVLALEVLWIYRLLLPSPPPSISVPRFAATAVALGVPILYLLLHFRGWPWRKAQAES
jgi:hypothetical protein